MRAELHPAEPPDYHPRARSAPPYPWQADPEEVVLARRAAAVRPPSAVDVACVRLADELDLAVREHRWARVVDVAAELREISRGGR
jgi:hypothetical protein